MVCDDTSCDDYTTKSQFYTESEMGTSFGCCVGKGVVLNGGCRTHFRSCRFWNARPQLGKSHSHSSVPMPCPPT